MNSPEPYNASTDQLSIFLSQPYYDLWALQQYVTLGDPPPATFHDSENLLFMQNPSLLVPASRPLTQPNANEGMPSDFQNHACQSFADYTPIIEQSTSQLSLDRFDLMEQTATFLEPPALITSWQNDSLPTPPNLSKPQDSGENIYSCTYAGCMQRFGTAQGMRMHKRGQHNSEYTSQAEVRRCTLINPSTGKRCNSLFSRPYDLTRHESTIHDNRKTKVKCNLCTEMGKTFSRPDALSRHIRVVHPDFQFTGSLKKRRNKK